MAEEEGELTKREALRGRIAEMLNLAQKYNLYSVSVADRILTVIDTEYISLAELDKEE